MENSSFGEEREGKEEEEERESEEEGQGEEQSVIEHSIDSEEKEEMPEHLVSSQFVGIFEMN